jgi:allantoinase
MSSFVVRSEKILIDHQFQARDLEIYDGKIKTIHPYNSDLMLPVVNVPEACVVLPGFVDTHAHINEPGRTEWEGFVTATRAALSGGITTVIDMPLNSIPATTTLKALQLKRKHAEIGSSIDFGFWGGVIPGNSNELIPMMQNNIMGFKCFLCFSGVDEFPEVNEDILRVAMPIIKAHGGRLIVHAEIEHQVENLDAHSKSYQTYLDSRPDQFETEAIQLMVNLCRETGCPTHIVHLSSAKALPIIEAAKKEGLPFTVETCPHYLIFEAEHIHEGHTHFKCAPPIRNNQNKEELWKAVKSGLIDFIVSDHSPCTPELKKMDKGEFLDAWGGIAGLQFSVSGIWTEMKKRNMSLEYLSQLMSANTARFIGIENKKGSIQVGADADLIFFNPNKKFTVAKDTVLHKHKLTPYEGMELFGVVETAFLRGFRVFHDKLFTEPTGKEVQKG